MMTFYLIVFIKETSFQATTDLVLFLQEVKPNLSVFFVLSEAAKAAHQSAIGGLVVDTPPHQALSSIGGPPAVLTNVPPPYQPVSVRHLDSQSSSEEPQDYLWLVNCESKKPEPNR